MPIQEQSKYLGSTYLPALAKLKSDQTNQQFTLQGSLAQIAQQRAQQAYGIQQDQLANDEKQREFDIEQAAKTSSGSGGSTKAAATPAFNGGNSQSTQAWIDWIKQNYNGTGWGDVAGDIESQAGQKIATGSNLDQALHYIYTGVL